ncbi:MAG: polysaccharide pyruvyl transferase family protein [Flavobacteriaceae bacterium]|nr:polysaccharide pyruvyl transferase family protein [Flavobacteriaceae bacterium]
MKKQEKTHILLNNVVPFNNGDVALFYSLYKKLIAANFSVEIATYNYKLAKKTYPNIPFVEELGQHKIFTKLPILKRIILPFLFLKSKAYQKATIIIGTPGGYINSNYAIRNSILIYKIAKKFGKKTAIYSQSVGPLNKKDGLFFKKLMENSIDYLFVRDSYSNSVLENLNVPKNKYSQTKDAAFLLGFSELNLNKQKKVAFSVRKWLYDGRSMELYKKMIAKLAKIVIDKGYTVDFLSTCQGLKTYKDDAVVAQEIYDSLDERYQEQITVLSDYYVFDDLYKKIEEYEFVLGTRLHMCILAMTKNIPAFNISYEIKGKECYNYLGFPEYSIDFNENIEKAQTSFINFIEKKEIMRKELKTIIPKLHKEAVEDFDFFMDKITKK